MEPPFIPEYRKPEAPGLSMNFDNTVSIWHVVSESDTFEEAAAAVFSMLREAQDRFPEWPRILFLDVAGHRGERHGFDEDFFEFQQDFWFSTVAHFVTAFDTPLTGALVNPQPQRNDLPDSLSIS